MDNKQPLLFMGGNVAIPFGGGEMPIGWDRMLAGIASIPKSTYLRVLAESGDIDRFWELEKRNSIGERSRNQIKTLLNNGVLPNLPLSKEPGIYTVWCLSLIHI